MKFVAFERKLQGTGASRRLRTPARCPASSTAPASPMIELDHNALFHALKKEAFHSPAGHGAERQDDASAAA
jgi:large subunit ribosomal protein L25